MIGCSVMLWSGGAIGQVPGAASPAGQDFNADTAVSNSASLPPPAPLPPTTMQALAAPAQPAPAVSIPGVMPGLPEPAVPVNANAAPMVSIPSTPAALAVQGGVSAVGPVAGVSDVPPVVLPPPPAERPDVVEPAKAIAPTNSPPLVSTASGGPMLPTILNSEIVAIQRNPLPEVTPRSPLIPGPSLAETANQKRQLTTLPGSGGDTNYAHATIGGPEGPASPLITPPTIIDPVHGTDIGKDYPPMQAVMPQAYGTPFYLDSPSAFGTPSPAHSLTYYLSKTMRRTPDMVQANPNPDNAEVIVLRGGQEFFGLVHDRGDTWRVELLNGTIMEIPGTKVASVRKMLAVPTSTPSARNMVFPPVEAYRERQLD